MSSRRQGKQSLNEMTEFQVSNEFDPANQENQPPGVSVKQKKILKQFLTGKISKEEANFKSKQLLKIHQRDKKENVVHEIQQRMEFDQKTWQTKKTEGPPIDLLKLE